MDRKVAHNTPMTVTNWLDMLNRLNPTEATFFFSASTIKPKVFSRLCHKPPISGPTATLVRAQRLEHIEQPVLVHVVLESNKASCRPAWPRR